MRNLQLKELSMLLKEFVLGGKFLKKSPYWSRDELLEWQWQKIRLMVTHAFENRSFYQKHYQSAGFEPGDLKSWDDFHQLPLVTKDDVIQNYPDGMLEKGHNLDELIVSRSSGSSGKVLDICFDSKGMVLFSLAGLRLYQMAFPYKPWHRQVYVYTSSYPFDSLFGMYPMHFVPTLTPIPEIIDRLIKINPHLLVCYPSHLKQIVADMTAEQISQLQLRGVSVNSEMSTQAERDHLSEVLGCPVLDEYSSEELTRIAAQCQHGAYHLFEDLNYMESQPLPDGQPGDAEVIIGTNLHNFAMPMIRYVQNDLGRYVDKKCPCGWKFRQLVQLQGRKNDSFLMPSGKEISSGFLLDATYEILLTWRTAVYDFCLVQESLEQIHLEVVKGAGWNEEIKSKIIGQFSNYFETGVNFKISEVAECTKTRSGKRNPIIRRF
ncbi:hypothetical protein CBD41_07555 [bacterium TMED181]|nr:hypothetical protein [Planctomycetota bacterium]OUW43215.1 MAG: hypothetical protein CBD41_07555 [bacterium TMED181]